MTSKSRADKFVFDFLEILLNEHFLSGFSIINDAAVNFATGAKIRVYGRKHKGNDMSVINCYWDKETKSRKERPATPAELAQREIDIAAAAMPLVPPSVPMLNARLALIAAGHMTQVKAFVDVMPGTEGE